LEQIALSEQDKERHYYGHYRYIGDPLFRRCFVKIHPIARETWAGAQNAKHFFALMARLSRLFLPPVNNRSRRFFA
jgi:hypothetical protein